MTFTMTERVDFATACKQVHHRLLVCRFLIYFVLLAVVHHGVPKVPPTTTVRMADNTEERVALGVCAEPFIVLGETQ